MSRASLSLAGFQVTIIGRFWVTAEITRMIEWGDDRLKQIDDYGEIHISGISRKKWDFFISHAAEEAEFARSLALKLEARGFTVWYDEFVLTAGDSLLEKIDEGLAHSRYGIAILSHAFFRKSWTKKELDGLAALEAKKKSQKVILPVWHDLTVEEVRKYSPSLAGRVGVPTKDGLDFVVGELLRAVKIPKE